MAFFKVEGLHPQAVQYIVTHGDKDFGPDPRMTAEGMRQVEALKKFLPKPPYACYCGVGRRHLDVTTVLGIMPQRCNPIVGQADSLVGPPKYVVLADGRKVPAIEYDQTGYREGVLALLNAQHNITVYCAGRPMLAALIGDLAVSAAVYRVNLDGSIEKISH